MKKTFQNRCLVPVEQTRHALNDLLRVNGMRLEVFHNVQELVVDFRVVSKLLLDLVEVHYSKRTHSIVREHTLW